VKRVLDVFVASLALIASFPIILVAALIVRLTSSGPSLFRQKRVGRFGKLFTIYKLRSMRVADGQLWSGHTKNRDPRLTVVGAWLRKYKLDELPQLFNVILGDMSLVGPRPKLPGHESIYMPYRPGITGAATLAFRYEEEMMQDIPLRDLEGFYSARIKPVKHELDSEYMAHATFSSDLLMLVRTAIACLLPRRLEDPLSLSKEYRPIPGEIAS
jgi:lipopolysaccharide/colanic/teichoic acid biosynthesis glycosyltransferase